MPRHHPIRRAPPHRAMTGARTFLLAALCWLTALHGASAQTGPAPAIGAYGFDASGMDRGVAPGDDFNRYANGAWLERAEIAPDRASVGSFSGLAELSLSRSRAILDTAASAPGSPIGDFYASFMDQASAERKGLVPLAADLAALRGAPDRAALARRMAQLQRSGVDGIVTLDIGADDKHPEAAIATLRQTSLGLPGRDDYLGAGAGQAHLRAAYVAYLAQLLALGGEADAPRRAGLVQQFETGVARHLWPAVAAQDVGKTYHRWNRRALAARAPGLDWDGYLAGLGLARADALLVAQPSAIIAAAALWRDTPLAVLKDWLALRLLDHYAPYLSAPYVAAQFDFAERTLAGTPELPPRWKRGVALVNSKMGEAVGQRYVAEYFPAAAKTAAELLVANLLAAYRQRLANVAWMAPATRTRALRKLASFKALIAYPDVWRDYAGLQIRRDDLVGNVLRAEQFESTRQLRKLGRPVDRGEWLFTPMDTRSWASRKTNVIIFPAANLQPPLFDPMADPAVNYGAIGVIIGHEISHHFDQQGRHYDDSGRLADWWQQADVARFTALTARLAAQFDAYQPLPGLHADGRRTLDENIADLAGLEVSLAAYRLSLGGAAAPVIDGTSGEQRFFLAYAQLQRQKQRPDALRRSVLGDDHAIAALRIATLRNLDAWYAAFDVQAGQQLYLAPPDRIHIW